MDAGASDDVPDMPVAAATPPMRTLRSQKTPIQKEALEAAFKSGSLLCNDHDHYHESTVSHHDEI
jgi:hypothetical protein